MIRNFTLTASAAALLAMPVASDAAVIFSLESDAPTGADLLEKLDPLKPEIGSGSIAWRKQASGATNGVAFAFQATVSGMMEDIGLLLNAAGSGTEAGTAWGDISVMIREVTTATAPASASAGTSLGTYTGTMNLTSDSFDGLWLNINLSDLSDQSGGTGGIAITEGNYYIIRLTFTSAENANSRVVIRRQETSDTTAADPNGLGSWDGGSWTQRPNRDYYYYIGGTQAIPEPSTYVMLGLAAASGVFYCRRKNG